MRQFVNIAVLALCLACSRAPKQEVGQVEQAMCVPCGDFCCPKCQGFDPADSESFPLAQITATQQIINPTGTCGPPPCYICFPIPNCPGPGGCQEVPRIGGGGENCANYREAGYCYCQEFAPRC